MTTRVTSQRRAFAGGWDTDTPAPEVALAGAGTNPPVSQADRHQQLPPQSPAFLPVDEPPARDCDTTPRYEEFESSIQGASITVTASIHNDVATTPVGPETRSGTVGLIDQEA